MSFFYTWLDSKDGLCAGLKHQLSPIVTGSSHHIPIVQWTEYGSSKPAIEVRILVGMPDGINVIFLAKAKKLCYTIYVKDKYWGVAKRKGNGS